MFVFSRFMRYFLEVARVGSIRRASESLNVSASAIDRQILAAEQELGVPLFERLPAGLRVSAAGELLLTSGGRWRKEFERFQEQVDDLVGLRRGHVRIAAIDALAKGFLPRLIHEIRQGYPGITVNLRIVDNNLVQDLMLLGEADFGLMISPQSSKEIIVHAYRDIFLGIAMPVHHPLAAFDQVRLSRCLEYPIIAPTEPLALYVQVAALEAATGLSLNPAVACDNIQMIKSVVSQGTGIGILTSLDVMDEVENGSLAFVRLSDSVLRPMPLTLCVGQARQLSRAARLVLDKLEVSLSDRGEIGL